MSPEIFIPMYILGSISTVYLLTRFHRFGKVKRIAKGNKPLSWIISAIPLLLLCGFLFINSSTMMMVILHLTLFWIFTDIFARTFNKIFKKQNKHYFAGLCAIVFTTVYLGIGWYNAHHVSRTEYTFYTSKDLGQDTLKIALIADLHLGITLDGEEFHQQMIRIEKEEPDLVVVAGDFVDDDTYKKDMLKACEALNVTTRYGVYFIYGNHDKGYYKYRDFDSNELEAELRKNHVTLLQDETVLINDSFYVIGRQDKTQKDRATAPNLTSDLDHSKYMIMIDHQPNAYDEEADSGADLVLSGHTHGGHIFPGAYLGEWFGMNDRSYGIEKRENTQFVVTSGISGWGIPFKTGTFSEYVMINIKEDE